jgi:FtsH-binding integral membrane protein
MAYQFQPSPYGRGAGVATSTQSLLGQVLGIVAIGFAITALAVYLITYTFGIALPPMVGIIAMFVGFGLLFGINGARANPGLSLGLFYAFAFAMGVGITPILQFYLHVAPDAVWNAAVTTAAGMGALGAIVYGTGLDLRRFQGIFFAALLGLIVVGIISIFVRFISPTIYSWATLIIFAGFTLINFARIRAGGDGLTAVQIAASTYLNALNIFLALLQIFGGRSSNRN